MEGFIWINGRYAYRCTIQNKPNGWYESSLRKKKPPEEEINWVEKLELVNWNPAKLKEQA